MNIEQKMDEVLAVLHARKEDLNENLLAHCFRQAPEGLVVEFGVWEGSSLWTLVKVNHERTIYGFDSFRGLPEDWTEGNPQGRFDLKGRVPANLPSQVQLVPGWFEDTVPVFFREHDDPIAFVHIDCDLYSSTKAIFNVIGHRLDNTVVCFDEIAGYPEEREHELKAFAELLLDHNYSYELLGRTQMSFIQAGFRLKKGQS